MTKEKPPLGTQIQDSHRDSEILDRQVIGQSFRPLYHVRARHKNLDGQWVSPQRRDILDGGKVVAVLVYDRVRDVLVLIRQYRLAADMAIQKGEIIEVVAGGVEKDETCEDAARRELFEETGLSAQSLRFCFDFMPSPGISTELASLFFAEVDSSQMLVRAGEDEDEEIAPFTISLDEALEALDRAVLVNGFLQIALLWFAREKSLNRL